jgi:hypothetical protein
VANDFETRWFDDTPPEGVRDESAFAHRDGEFYDSIRVRQELRPRLSQKSLRRRVAAGSARGVSRAQSRNELDLRFQGSQLLDSRSACIFFR